MKTPQQIAEAALVGVVIANVETLARMCRNAAPRAAVILEAAALRLREEYGEAEKGPDA